MPIFALANNVSCNQHYLPTDSVIYTTVKDQELSSSIFKIGDKTFTGYQTANSLPLIDNLKKSAFEYQLYTIIFKSLNLDFSRECRILTNKDRTHQRLYIKENESSKLYFFDGDEIESDSALRKALIAAKVIKLFLNDTSNGELSVAKEDKKYTVVSYSMNIEDKTFNQEINLNQFLGKLDPYEQGIDSLLHARKVLAELPFSQIRNLIHVLGLPDSILAGLMKRQISLINALDAEIEILFGDSRANLKKIKHSKRQLQNKKNARIILQLRNSLKERLEKDFKTHTNFESFDEYKKYVMQFPEYREIIENFQKNALLKLSMHNIRRTSILKNGFKNIFETGTSSIQDSNQYKDIRAAVESEGLGISQSTYESLISPEIRPKSAYVKNRNTLTFSGTRYGNDHYLFDINELLTKSGNSLVTFTLGDSLDNSHIWYSKPLLAEDFPYLAAPFIHDYQKKLNSSEFAVINYRMKIPGSQLPAVLPEFLGNLDKRLRVQIRNDYGFLEPTGPSVDYIESQVFGYLGIDSAKKIAIPENEAPTQQLNELYTHLGIEIIKYQEDE